VEPLLRKASPEDLPFVLDATRRSLRDRYPWVHVPEREWAAEIHPRLVALTNTSHTVIACDPDATDVIWGFAICEPESRVLHYVYVKYAFRGWGIARALVASVWPDVGEVPIVATAMPDGRHVSEVGRHRMTYNPFKGLFANKEIHGTQG
jgi:hypothetical protein